MEGGYAQAIQSDQISRSSILQSSNFIRETFTRNMNPVIILVLTYVLIIGALEMKACLIHAVTVPTQARENSFVQTDVGEIGIR